MTILAFDPGAVTGWAVIDVGRNGTDCLLTDDWSTGVEMITAGTIAPEYAAWRLAEMLTRDCQPDVVLIEIPQFAGANRRPSAVLSRYAGALAAGAACAHVPTINLVPVEDWIGTRKKPASRMEVHVTLGHTGGPQHCTICPADHNAMDALALALWWTRNAKLERTGNER